MAACWYWCLLLCSLAACGSAAPIETEKSEGKTEGKKAQEFSSDNPQLTDLTQGASDTGISSVDNKTLQVVQNILRNSQSEVPQQGSDQAKEEDPSINHKGAQPDAIESRKAQEHIDKSQEDKTDTSDTKSNIKESEHGQDLSIKSQNIQSGLPAQDSSSKLGLVQPKKGQKEHHPEGTNAIDKESKQSQDPKDRKPQSSQSAQQPGTAKLDATKASKASADIDKSEDAQTDTSGTSSLPKSKMKESKQGEDPSIKGPNPPPGVSAQDSSKLNPDRAGNTQEKKDHLEEPKTDISHSGLNVKESEQSLDLQTKDQNPQSVLSAQEPASGKIHSSEAINIQEDKSDQSSVPKSKTKELKQGENPLIKGLNAQSGASAQDSSKLDLAHAKNEESKTDISDPDFSELEINDESKQVEDSLAKGQDLQSDLSVQQSQKLNPVESKKTEEVVVDSGDEQGKRLADEKKKNAKHEEDLEGTPRNGSENSHFFAYLVTTAIIVAALYIAYHNKRKIIAFALEGKKSKITRRPKSSDYQRLDQKI
uniref:Trans-Golgi network integral membrane protein 2 n=1 Tax=Laticauda laticaudata TaxID=8630 RepID=A0A8C5SVK8_LATLA